ncbi:tryptophan 7-halogenase [Streptomyces sp. G-G2]|uniref:tryptophan 7-halogenase n=1 Tax=Streptomyces sp. G-G2 TaxID=3046201 RepID=UPI0024BBD47A|nr:tryptophan 7-halogenase [Streptomyces sp. G-G2]MDJ0382264.1 tryptophan 7-halogenase [Streptomyces sp. G-G2]
MDRRMRKVVVVGGSVAGWTVAARLAGTWRGTVAVTVLQTPCAVPDLAETGQVTAVPPEFQSALFDPLGVAEDDWTRACGASFRTAVRYVNWRTEGPLTTAARTLANGAADHFYRPRAHLPECGNNSLSPYWQYLRSEGLTAEPFDYACFREPPLMDAMKSPRWLDGRAAFPYGWHVDTLVFRAFLRDLAVRRLDVRAVHDSVRSAERDENGMLTALRTEKGRRIEGDLFVDCTGQQGLLLGKVLGEPFVGAQERLLCDSAATVTVAHDDTAHGIEPFATATALPTGWSWKLPLPGRFGAGLVYPRARTAPDEAAGRLCELYGLDPGRAEVRHARYRFGRSRRAWVKNCVALGTAAWQVEPLAGDALDEVLGAVGLLIRDAPSLDAREAPAARFNRAARDRYERAADAVQLHYAAAPRADSGFWRAQRALPLSGALRECVEAHRGGLSPEPGQEARYGLLSALVPVPGGLAQGTSIGYRPDARRSAEEQLARVKRRQRILLETLPTAHAYLERLHRRAAA